MYIHYIYIYIYIYISSAPEYKFQLISAKWHDLIVNRNVE